MEAVGGSRAGAPRANKNRTCLAGLGLASSARRHFVPLNGPQVCADTDTPLRPLPAPCRHYPLSQGPLRWRLGARSPPPPYLSLPIQQSYHVYF
jgi:hypothetical protein